MHLLFTKYPKVPLQKSPEIFKASFGEYEFTNLLLQSKIFPLLKENKLNAPNSPDITMADLPEELEISRSEEKEKQDCSAKLLNINPLVKNIIILFG
jgi:hypothetical protein